jgi:hypothetical protein
MKEGEKVRGTHVLETSEEGTSKDNERMKVSE